MKDLFYVIESNGGYQLRLRETHLCLSCGSTLAEVLDIAKRHVVTYRRPEKFMKVIESLDGSGKVCPSE